MREELLSIGDDYWIEDESGRRAFKVDGKQCGSATPSACGIVGWRQSRRQRSSRLFARARRAAVVRYFLMRLVEPCCGALITSSLRSDLDQVAAGVVEHGGGHRAHGCRLLREVDPKAPQALVLALDVVHAE